MSLCAYDAVGPKIVSHSRSASKPVWLLRGGGVALVEQVAGPVTSGGYPCQVAPWSCDTQMSEPIASRSERYSSPVERSTVVSVSPPPLAVPAETLGPNVDP